MRVKAYKTSQASLNRHRGYPCPRRTALVAVLAPFAGCSAQADPLVKGSLQEQIDQCKAGGHLSISGRYEEQLVISKPITLSSSPDDPASIQWQTTQPYQSAITVMPGGRLSLSNVSIRHSSPSVANNYALFVRGGDAEMIGCDISSNTGSGIGIEGGMVTIVSSRIHDCRGNGAVVAGAIDVSASLDATEDGMAAQSEARFLSCELSGNGGSGLIALDGSVVELERCNVSKNAKAGLELRDCEASLDGCTVTQNRQASILQKRSTPVQILQSSGKNVVQPRPEFYK